MARLSTSHRFEFPTHGTFHIFKVRTAKGGWTKRSHYTDICNESCSLVTGFPLSVIRSFPQAPESNLIERVF